MDSSVVYQASPLHSKGDKDKICEIIVPECFPELKPHVGQKFHLLEEGISFYKQYAASCGFDTRLGTITKAEDGTIVSRYILCNKEGEKSVSKEGLHGNSIQNVRKRRRLSSRTNCMARVIFHFVAGEGYVVKTFVEGHNHNLVSVGYRHFMKINRKLDKAHKSFILDCAKANIGPMRSFRIFKELVGGYDNIGCTIIDFKNFTRDLRAYVSGADAQMILDKLKQKRELCTGFTFDFFVDESEKLTRLFWADSHALKKYEIFGDVVSFDATYSTNRYNMIFAPFTGKDNYGRCVTFGAGLLSSEDVDSYSWVFQKFQECVGKDPKLLITDQDPAIKIAVERIFPNTRHRFCMWHIMLKVADKIPTSLKEDEGFTKKLNEIVWSDHLEPEQFDEKWNVIMEEFGLSGHKWFVKMFNLRSFWIPAYFRDVQLSGLFRTTSMSESENSFFRRYLNKGSNLVEFFMHYGTAMDAQRNAHDQLSHLDESCFPNLKTNSPLEKHAASIYSHEIFYDAQRQIIAAADVCCVTSITSGPESTVYEVDDDVNGKFNVVHILSDDSVTCDCKRFSRRGLLCRHLFFVFKNMKLHSIPERYILNRWKKFACPKFVGTFIGQDVDVSASNDVVSDFYSCFGLVKGTKHMNEFRRDMRELKDKYFNTLHSVPLGDGKENAFNQFYGSSIPDKVLVLPPDIVKTKGSGSRLKSRKEKALLRQSKPLRRCSKCKKMCNHDARNCPNVPSTNSGV